jgi:hypothetical protein
MYTMTERALSSFPQCSCCVTHRMQHGKRCLPLRHAQPAAKAACRAEPGLPEDIYIVHLALTNLRDPTPKGGGSCILLPASPSLRMFQLQQALESAMWPKAKHACGAPGIAVWVEVGARAACKAGTCRTCRLATSTCAHTRPCTCHGRSLQHGCDILWYHLRTHGYHIDWKYIPCGIGPPTPATSEPAADVWSNIIRGASWSWCLPAGALASEHELGVMGLQSMSSWDGLACGAAHAAPNVPPVGCKPGVYMTQPGWLETIAAQQCVGVG